MKRKFIVNHSCESKLPNKSFRSLGDVEMARTLSREEAIVETRNALKSGYDEIVAVGGDGTLNAVVNGFFEAGKPINKNAILIPTQCGTGSDYYQGVMGKYPWEKLLLNYQAKIVDLGCVSFLNQEIDPSFFINMGSVGISYEVVNQQKNYRDIFPPLMSYSLPAIQSVFSYDAPRLEVKVNGILYQGEFLAVFFAKGKTAGGGMKLGGAVALDDGALDITLVYDMPLFERIRKFGRLFTGQLEGDKRFLKLKASQLEIFSIHKKGVEFDGELIGHTDIDVTVVPSSIKLAVPVLG